MQVHTEEALERLLRLGLVHHATPPSAHATAHASAAGAAGLSGGSGSCSLADDRSDSGKVGGALDGRRGPGAAGANAAGQDYTAVPVADALARLRTRWGEKARVHMPAATAARNAPALLMLTAPTTHGAHVARSSSHDFERGEPSPSAERSGMWLAEMRSSAAHLE